MDNPNRGNYWKSDPIYPIPPERQLFKVPDITGGWNGNGDWGTYFGALEEFIRKLAREKIRAWLINMDNDCLDDVFTASFGLKKEKEESE